MNELPPEAASLLDAERRAQRAPEADLDRTLARLHASLLFADVAGAGTSVQAAQAATTPSAAPALTASKGALFAGKSLKVLLAGVTLGGVIGGTVLGVRMQQGERAQPRSPTVAVGSPERRDQPLDNDAERELPPLAAESAGSAERGAVSGVRASETVPQVPHAARAGETVERAASAPKVRGKSGAREEIASAASARARRSGEISAASSAAAGAVAAAREPPQQPPQQPSAEPEATVAAAAAPSKRPQSMQPSELDLIDSAFAQLRAHQGESALALLARHGELYPRGKFATEAAGLRVLALCEVGRLPEGRDARAVFLARASDSPIAARVRAACAPERP